MSRCRAGADVQGWCRGVIAEVLQRCYRVGAEQVQQCRCRCGAVQEVRKRCGRGIATGAEVQVQARCRWCRGRAEVMQSRSHEIVPLCILHSYVEHHTNLRYA